MHEQARTVYFSLRGRERDRFLATFARLNGDAAAREIEPGYELAGMAIGVRGSLCAGKATDAAQALFELSGKEARGGGFDRAGDGDQTTARRSEGIEIAGVGQAQMMGVDT